MGQNSEKTKTKRYLLLEVFPPVCSPGLLPQQLGWLGGGQEALALREMASCHGGLSVRTPLIGLSWNVLGRTAVALLLSSEVSCIQINLSPPPPILHCFFSHQQSPQFQSIVVLGFLDAVLLCVLS